MRTYAALGVLVLVGCGMSGPAGAGTWAEWQATCVPGDSDPACVDYPARMLEVPGAPLVCSMGVAPSGETIATVRLGTDAGPRLDLQELRFANGALVGCTGMAVTEPGSSFVFSCTDSGNESDLSLAGRVIAGSVSFPRAGPSGARFAVLGSIHIECPAQ